MKPKYLILTLLLLLIFFKTKAQYGSPFPDHINQADFIEAQPYISFDGQHLIYVSVKEEKNYFYTSHKDNNGVWQDPKPIEEINNYGSENRYIASPSFNYDATIIYYEADYDKDNSDIDIYYSKLENDKWSEPKKMPEPINSKQYDGEPSITADNKTIYFTRINEDAEVKKTICKKIFFSNQISEGKWSKPKALPSPLNLDCEATPRILADNKTLFLSSVREEGRGGFDIYYAKKISDNVWVLPISIDTVNTDEDELYPTTDADGNLISFFRTNDKRKIDIKGLYNSTLPSQFKPESYYFFYGKVTDLNKNSPIDATLQIVDPFTSRILMEYQTNKNGEYQFFLPIGKNLIIDIFSKNYSHTFLNINPQKLEKNQHVRTNIKLYKKVKLQMNVFDEDLFEPIDVKLTVEDAETKEKLNIRTPSITTGRFNMILPIGRKYNIITNHEYYDKHTLNLDLSGVVQFDEFERDVELTSRKQAIEFLVTESNSKKGIPVQIEIINLSTNEKYLRTVMTNEKGMVKTYLRKGDKYDINISPKGYTFYNTTVDLEDDKIEKKEKIEVNVELTELKQEAKLELKNITFETNSAELNASSFEELNRVVKLMQDNPDIKIEIAAHTDDVGSSAYNLKLSNKRAESVVNYLIEKEISYSRMIAKGYGEDKPLVENNSDENRAKNRRVELEILEKQ